MIGLGRPSFTVPALVHEPTQYAFAFDVNSRGSHWAIYRPGPEGPTHRTHTKSWSAQLEHVTTWLEHVQEAYLAPDLWASLGAEQQVIAALSTGDDDNTPFTDHERELIADQLEALKAQISNSFQLQGVQLRELEERIEYLVGATNRLGRFDWKQALLSQLLSLILLALLPREAAAAIFDFIGQHVLDLSRVPGHPELPGTPGETL